MDDCIFPLEIIEMIIDHILYDHIFGPDERYKETFWDFDPPLHKTCKCMAEIMSQKYNVYVHSLYILITMRSMDNGVRYS